MLAELEREPDAAVFLHDYHLYLAPRHVRERAPDARSRTSSTSRGRSRTFGACCPKPIRRAVHEGLLANDVVGFHTDRWRRNFVRSCDGLLGCRVDREGSIARRSPAGDRSSPRARSRSTRPSSTQLPKRRVRRLEEELDRRAARVLVAPRRPHRSVEERRPRLPRIRALARRPSRAARPRRDARAPRPVAAGHSRVRGVPRRDPASGARRQRPLPAARAGSRSICGSRTTSRSRSRPTSSTTCCS